MLWSICNNVRMKNKPKVYAKQNLKDVVEMHTSKGHFARRMMISQSQVTQMLKDKPVQMGLIAGVLMVTELPFENLFEVR